MRITMVILLFLYTSSLIATLFIYAMGYKFLLRNFQHAFNRKGLLALQLQLLIQLYFYSFIFRHFFLRLKRTLRRLFRSLIGILVVLNRVPPRLIRRL
jgi:hypothetical protein